jgi:hypothetical protein
MRAWVSVAVVLAVIVSGGCSQRQLRKIAGDTTAEVRKDAADVVRGESAKDKENVAACQKACELAAKGAENPGAVDKCKADCAAK